MIFVVAIVIRDTVGAFFHRTKLPQINAIAAFQTKTAHGKLNADIIPTIPKGFQTYIIKCSGLSDGKIEPLN
jgi:hypothetical protein